VRARFRELFLETFCQWRALCEFVREHRVLSTVCWWALLHSFRAHGTSRCVNNSGKPILWLDGLDIPLTQALHQLFFEPYTKEQQAIEASSDRVAAFYGHARPPAVPPQEFFHYKWVDTYRDLQRLRQSAAGRDPFDGYFLEFLNPRTGGPTMPTIQCAVHEAQCSESRTRCGGHRTGWDSIRAPPFRLVELSCH
jgi:hypothetical protein